MKPDGDPVIDYATCGPSDIWLRHITILLRNRDALRSVEIATKLILGVAASILVPTLLLLLLGFQFDSIPVLGTRFWQFVVCVAAIYLVIGCYLGWRLDDSRLLDQVRYLATSFGPLSRDQPFTQTSWDVEMQYEGGMAILWVGILIFGPRMVMEGLQQLRARARLRPLNRERAAQVVFVLLPLDHGVLVEQLRNTGEDGRALAFALAFLRLQDWIDVSRDGRRVWLLSDARKALRTPGIRSGFTGEQSSPAKRRSGDGTEAGA